MDLSCMPNFDNVSQGYSTKHLNTDLSFQSSGAGKKFWSFPGPGLIDLMDIGFTDHEAMTYHRTTFVFDGSFTIGSDL